MLRAVVTLGAGLALALLPIGFVHPLALVPLWLAQPAFALGVAWLRGTRRGPDPVVRGAHDAVALALLWAAAYAGSALFAAWPLRALRESGSLGAALGLSAAAGFALIVLWRLWPMFAQSEREGGGLAALAARVVDGERARARGLAIAAGLLAVVALGLAIAWPQLAADARTGLILAHALVAPLVHAAVSRWGGMPAPRTAAGDAELEEDAEGAEPDRWFDPDAPPGERIYAAARAGRVDLALAALEAGADPHAPPAEGERDQRSLPMLAALHADLRLLRELIGRGVDLNRRQGELTPLLAATRDSWHGRPDAVMTLLANGADPRAADADGDTPLHHAARSGDAGVAALLLDAGAPLETPNTEGLSPLGAACAIGNWRLARFLLDRGARPEPPEGQPALLAAAGGEDDPAGAALLLKHKAQVDARGADNRSALMVACAAGNADIAAALLAAGADINARDAHGATPLLDAARNGREPVLAKLAAAQSNAGKLDPTAVDDAGRNALAVACAADVEPALIRRLCELGVDPRLPDRDGKSALDHAIATGRWRLVVALQPDYPLPASVLEDLGEDARPRAPGELLREALAERRFDEAETMLRLQGEAASRTLAALLPAFAGESDGDRFAWLLAHGAQADLACDETGDSPLFRLLDRGAAASGALTRLLERGVAPSGGGGLARYLAACIEGEHVARTHEQLALALLERGADPFGAARPDAGTPLALAVRLGWLRLAERLLALGADTEARDARGMTPLHQACALGREAAVRLLVKYGASPDARAADGQSPLGIALADDRRELAAWLEWQGWRPSARALQPADLAAAAIVGDAEAVRRLLDLGLAVDAADAQGCTALLRAAGGGHRAVVEVLLARGADASLAAHTGATPLSAAVSMRQAEIVERLLAHGARVDQALPGAVTPLMLAAALGLPELASRLLARGADVHAHDEQGLMPLHCAGLYVFQSHDRARAIALIDTLLFAGAEPDAANDAAQTPLLLLLGARAEPGTACEEDVLLAALERLLEEEVALDAQDAARGFAPLHLGALHGLPRIVQRLLRAGADPGQRDALGRTPHEVAVLRGFVDVAAEFEPVRSNVSLARFLKGRE